MLLFLLVVWWMANPGDDTCRERTRHAMTPAVFYHEQPTYLCTQWGGSSITSSNSRMTCAVIQSHMSILGVGKRPGGTKTRSKATRHHKLPGGDCTAAP